MEEKREKIGRKTNNVAFSIKTISVLLALIGIIGGCLMIVFNILKLDGIFYIVGSVVGGILMYAIGEFLQLIEDIKNKL